MKAPKKLRDGAFKLTRNMYEERIEYLLGLEINTSTQLLHEIRRARDEKREEPKFNDPFKSYTDAVQSVLSHLKFGGVDAIEKTIVYDSAGEKLHFFELSGGEREIAFILGQIDRFNLTDGMLLIDEPELHLNPELVRLFISYLYNTVNTGQFWIGTHSMDAVEVAGKAATFVLERNESDRLVSDIRPLKDRPALQVLSQALGSPAFSLRNTKFIFIEGERMGSEAERFAKYMSNRPSSCTISSFWGMQGRVAPTRRNCLTRFRNRGAAKYRRCYRP